MAPHCGFQLRSLVVKMSELLFPGILAVCVSSGERCLSTAFAFFSYVIYLFIIDSQGILTYFL